MGIRDMKEMLLLPVAKMVLVGIVIVWWMFVTTALGSAGSIQETGNATFPTRMDDCTAQQIADLKFCSGGDSTKCCEFETGPTKEVKWNETMYGLFFYHFFGLLWTAAFILAAMNFTLSSATATWYFAESENGELNLGSPVKTGLRRAFGKHGGTLAFGSFLVATLEMIRMIVDYMAKKANKEAKESGNKVVQCVIGCITCIAMCCVRCVEACIKYITSEAYIFTALFGKGLCESVSNPWLPLIISCCVAYMVTCLFMAVFARTVDTLLVCFVADERMQKNYGTPSRKPDLSKGINEHAPPPAEEITFT